MYKWECFVIGDGAGLESRRECCFLSSCNPIDLNSGSCLIAVGMSGGSNGWCGL